MPHHISSNGAGELRAKREAVEFALAIWHATRKEPSDNALIEIERDH